MWHTSNKQQIMKRLIVVAFVLFAAFPVTAQQLYAEIPQVTLGGKTSGSISLDEVIAAGKLQTARADMLVTHFSLTLVSNGILVSRASNSNVITEQMIEQLKKLSQKQRFLLTDIRLLKPGGEIIQAKALTFLME
jgi:hypothetical protein